MVFENIWVAYDEDHLPAHWALGVGSEIARACGARLVVSHIAPPAEEPVSDHDGLLDELLGLREDVRRRQRLVPAVALAARGVDSDVSVVSGPVVPELLDQLHHARPDLVVLGDGRGRVARALRAHAPCPVLFVRGPHDPSGPIVVVGGDGSRRLTGAASLPLLVVPRRARMVDGTPAAMTTTRTSTSPAARSRVARAARVTLLARLFGASAVVVVLATLVLLLTPVSVSREVVLAEAALVLAGLALLLLTMLAVLRRGLAPLRELADVMGSIDPHHPGRRLPDTPATPAEVRALTAAFNDMLDRLEDERRDSARRALAAQEDERLRIAREMHDQIGQTLTAVALQAERAAQAETVDRELLERLAASAHASLDDVRRLARELRPEALDDLGLGNALITLCRRMSVEGSLRVEAHLQPAMPTLTPEAELVVYRVAQESLTNALRHARATRADVTLSHTGDAVELVVADDGAGLPEDLREGTTGIAGMRERALLAGGRLALDSSPGEGTEVRLELPLDGAARL